MVPVRRQVLRLKPGSQKRLKARSLRVYQVPEDRLMAAGFSLKIRV